MISRQFLAAAAITALSSIAPVAQAKLTSENIDTGTRSLWLGAISDDYQIYPLYTFPDACDQARSQHGTYFFASLYCALRLIENAPR